MGFFEIGAMLRAVWTFLTMPLGGGRKRDEERNMLLEELKAQRDQYVTLMTNHIAHLDARHDAQTVAMQDASVALREVAKSLELLHGATCKDHEKQQEEHRRVETLLIEVKAKMP